MKSFLTAFLAFVTLPTVAQQFRYVPERPVPGGVVSFTYTPGVTLAKEAVVEGRYVRYAGPATMRLSQPTTATAIRQGNDIIGELKIPKNNIAGLLLAFQSKTNTTLIDHNNGHFFPILLHDSTGALQPHAIGGQASVLTRTAFPYSLKVKPDWNWTVQQYEQEIKTFPANRPQYWADLIAAQIRQQKPNAKKTALTNIDTYLKSRKTSLTPEDLNNAARLYEQLSETTLAQAARDRIKTVDPTGDAAQKARAAAVRAEVNAAKKLTAFSSFTQAFPTSAYRSVLVSSVAETYFKAGQFGELVTFLGQQSLKDSDPELLHSFAQQMTDEGRGIPQATWVANRAIAALRQRTQPKGSETERASQLRAYQATLAYALALQKQTAPALATYRLALEGVEPDLSDPRTSERLWQCAIQASRADSVLPYIESVVKAGRVTPRLRSSLRDWQAKRLGGQSQAETYVRGLEINYRAYRRADLAETFVNDPAPGFTLSTLDGSKVSLASLRGKVVVLDFWATWCGPCIASFPAMRQARDYFKNDPNVLFLFVNTREGGPISRVHSFMARQPYTGVVPIDQNQKVADSYGVQGIPTKVIIDPKGRVRYRSLGYSGNAEATAEEITLVIEALKQ
ncbi:TlpA family protein disulfide reductase [Fibrella aquatica]|uniref:TlpA family protein disulfide reductase n=1 Tax=Fibrella aquatica TaxID=3242487 RepID=UPI0035226724